MKLYQFFSIMCVLCSIASNTGQTSKAQEFWLFLFVCCMINAILQAAIEVFKMK